MLIVEIVRVRGGYYVSCAGHVWVGFREEADARRFVAQKLADRHAVVVYREGGGEHSDEEARRRGGL